MTAAKLGAAVATRKHNRLPALLCGLLAANVFGGSRVYTALFWIQTLLHVLLVAWLVRIYRESGLLAAAVLIIPQAGLVWDNGVVAAGSLIGIGETLKALSWHLADHRLRRNPAACGCALGADPRRHAGVLPANSGADDLRPAAFFP
jgi:hypothetical protein